MLFLRARVGGAQRTTSAINQWFLTLPAMQPTTGRSHDPVLYSDAESGKLWGREDVTGSWRTFQSSFCVILSSQLSAEWSYPWEVTVNMSRSSEDMSVLPNTFIQKCLIGWYLAFSFKDKQDVRLPLKSVLLPLKYSFKSAWNGSCTCLFFSIVKQLLEWENKCRAGPDIVHQEWIGRLCFAVAVMSWVTGCVRG